MIKDLSSYQLGDFVMFSESVYLEIIKLYLNQIWPFHFVSLGLSAFILYLLFRKVKRRWVFLITGGFWFFIGYFFYSQNLLSITWVAQYLAYICYLQGSLLILTAGIAKADPSHHSVHSVQRHIGLLIFAMTAVFPFSWPPLVFGYGPLSTALGTIILLWMSLRKRSAFVLSLLPTLVAIFHLLLFWYFLRN